jgi:CheY-like chemotaxis protein
MGGSIELRSSVGMGSEFTLRVPLAISKDSVVPVGIVANIEKSVTAPRPVRSNPLLQGLKVLVAEDNPINQKLVQTILERAGCEVSIATDGYKALEYLSLNYVDIVVMDVDMPVLDGIAATRVLREREVIQGWKHMPILALTAHAMLGDAERCLEAGMDDYLSKPFDRSALCQKLSELVAANPRPPRGNHHISSPKVVNLKLVER